MQVRLAAVAAVLFFASACAQLGGFGEEPRQERLPDGGPPVVNGFYETPDRACSAQCEDGLAKRPAALRERPHPSAPVVATTDANEWLSLVGGLYRMRPLRGVVTEPFRRELTESKVIEFKAGDIVYLIDDRADSDVPSAGLWFRDDYFYITAPGFEQGDEVPLIATWQSRSDEQQKADEAAGAGWWALVQRDNGQRGYVLRSDLECWWPVEKDPPAYCVRGRER